MKKPKKGTSATVSNATIDPTSNAVDSRPWQSERCTRDEVTVIDDESREALSTYLHELLNSLWPAAARIELAITEESCPPKFREILEQLGRCVDEAMTIASQASALVDSPMSERVPP